MTYESDDIGNQVPEETTVEIWAEEIGVRQSEFYKAAVAGLKPERTFVIWASEYSGQTKIEADEVKYKLIRAYNNPSKSEMVELVCEKVVGDG